MKLTTAKENSNPGGAAKLGICRALQSLSFANSHFIDRKLLTGSTDIPGTASEAASGHIPTEKL
jgi:hypothetical protein